MLNTEKTKRIGFLLVPNFSLIAFSSAIEPLRMANWITGADLYTSCLVSQDGKAVISSAGVSTEVDHSLDQLPRLDMLFVCAGLLNNRRATIHWWDMERLKEDFPTYR